MLGAGLADVTGEAAEETLRVSVVLSCGLE